MGSQPGVFGTVPFKSLFSPHVRSFSLSLIEKYYDRQVLQVAQQLSSVCYLSLVLAYRILILIPYCLLARLRVCVMARPRQQPVLYFVFCGPGILPCTAKILYTQYAAYTIPSIYSNFMNLS
jgi:hypothetical protein